MLCDERPTLGFRLATSAPAGPTCDHLKPLPSLDWTSHFTTALAEYPLGPPKFKPRPLVCHYDGPWPRSKGSTLSSQMLAVCRSKSSSYRSVRVRTSFFSISAHPPTPRSASLHPLSSRSAHSKGCIQPANHCLFLGPISLHRCLLPYPLVIASKLYKTFSTMEYNSRVWKRGWETKFRTMGPAED